jgi:hypothetical protein
MLVIACALSLLLCLLAPWAEGQYTEQLDLHPLPQSQLLAAFNFKANTTKSDFDAQNCISALASVAGTLRTGDNDHDMAPVKEALVSSCGLGSMHTRTNKQMLAG